jgi:restriction system protein
MARRKKSSSAEDMVEIVAMLPWWAGSILALISYVWLHRIATQPAITILVPGQAAAALTQSLWQALATIGQYVLPVLCLAGAAVSAYGRHRRQKLVTTVTGGDAADALNGITWQDFELLVGEAFRLQGYQVAESGGGGADGGIDLVLRKGSEKFFVQCKQWKAFTVGVTVVRELYGVMAADGAAGGFVVTSGRFTDQAKAFASGRNVKLVDGSRLFGMIKQAQTARSNGTTVPDLPPVPEHAHAHAHTVIQPSCPVCGNQMLHRTAKRGSAAGNSFWGCSGYPACRGTRQIG